LKIQRYKYPNCPGCRNKKDVSAWEIENLISEQLTLEIDLVTKDIRDDRLAICGECPDLLGYTCLKCGCFAKFRASLVYKSCPARKW